MDPCRGELGEALELLGGSKDELAELANEALTECRDGGTEELDPDEL
ncbi:MAG: hypothetical protein ACE5F1_02440 [Planctomycetota bacterium]